MSHGRRLIEALGRYQQPDGVIEVGYVTSEHLLAHYQGRPKNNALYGVHKLLTGLYEMYRYADDPQALEIACRWAENIAGHVNSMAEEELEGMLSVEQGGIAEVMFDLAAAAGRQAYLDAAVKLLSRSVMRTAA